MALLFCIFLFILAPIPNQSSRVSLFLSGENLKVGTFRKYLKDEHDYSVSDANRIFVTPMWCFDRKLHPARCEKEGHSKPGTNWTQVLFNWVIGEQNTLPEPWNWIPPCSSRFHPWISRLRKDWYISKQRRSLAPCALSRRRFFLVPPHRSEPTPFNLEQKLMISNRHFKGLDFWRVYEPLRVH